MSVELEKRVAVIETKLAVMREQQASMGSNLDRLYSLVEKDLAKMHEMQMAIAKLQTKVLLYGSAIAIGLPVAAMFFTDFLQDFLVNGAGK